jgi:hypothetical protein
MAAYEFPLPKREGLIYIYVDVINAKELLLFKYNKVRRSFKSD